MIYYLAVGIVYQTKRLVAKSAKRITSIGGVGGGEGRIGPAEPVGGGVQQVQWAGNGLKGPLGVSGEAFKSRVKELKAQGKGGLGMERKKNEGVVYNKEWYQNKW